MMAGVTESSRPTERALDLFLYAPLGALAEAAARLPSYAEKGRVHVGNARVLGQFAVQMGRKQAEDRLGQVHDDARGLLAQFGLLPPTQPTTAPERAAAPAHAPVASSPAASVENGAAGLAIPSYDSLAASQVVARLAGLRPDELDAIARYEQAHRGRKTVLGRIAQLQA